MELQLKDFPKKIPLDSIAVKSIYESKDSDGTYRIFIDRTLPREIKKSEITIDEWNKQVAPSPRLTKCLKEKITDFDLFSKLYVLELLANEKELDRIRKIAKHKKITLLCKSQNPSRNHALILNRVLLQSL
ncbi:MULTISPECIES: DUF488 domain-containing protein [unclassified Flavobacterium]|uniref:DUF488 domain-containing protein n=1 Tax=unclassified Flavobacterium TaxID=196869 RepID=UPI000EAD35FE|nr:MULTISPECIES: DUF488 family protein [unclassified Flavobacterium]RKS01653.1 uncharacterized protein YeaO (DUF488 family) [Flavobacterium sp. 102]